MLCAVACLVGCQDPRGPARVGSDDPDLKILAIKQDVSTHSEADVAKMVEGLQSDDAAVRFYCIQGLCRLTHDNFGYRYYERDDDRAAALARWQQWLKQRRKK
jgi:hypothetical protein